MKLYYFPKYEKSIHLAIDKKGFIDTLKAVMDLDESLFDAKFTENTFSLTLKNKRPFFHERIIGKTAGDNQHTVFLIVHSSIKTAYIIILSYVTLFVGIISVFAAIESIHGNSSEADYTFLGIGILLILLHIGLRLFSFLKIKHLAEKFNNLLEIHFPQKFTDQKENKYF